jgi:hypothetical protein
MSASVSEVAFNLHASGDGTWYVEVVSPGIACTDVGDFRSKASAEAWIRDSQKTHAANASGAYPADAEIVKEDSGLAG